MKREDIRKLLENADEQSVEERLDAIMRANGSDVENAKKGVSALQSALDEAKGKLDEFEKTKQAQLSDKEKLEAALAKLGEQQRELAVKSNRVDAKSILSGLGLDEETMEAQLGLIVSEDAEATAAGAKSLAALITTQRESAKAEAEKAMLAKLGKPQGGSGENPVTKEQFAKMTYSEKLKLKTESPDLFKTLDS